MYNLISAYYRGLEVSDSDVPVQAEEYREFAQLMELVKVYHANSGTSMSMTGHPPRGGDNDPPQSGAE